jgi:hypothetical protein
VQFGLQITGAVGDPTADELAEAREPEKLAPPASGAVEAPGEKVVSLDAFRKK